MKEDRLIKKVDKLFRRLCELSGRSKFDFLRSVMRRFASEEVEYLCYEKLGDQVAYVLTRKGENVRKKVEK